MQPLSDKNMTSFLPTTQYESLCQWIEQTKRAVGWYLLVSPPLTGKTMSIKHALKAIYDNTSTSTASTTEETSFSKNPAWSNASSKSNIAYSTNLMLTKESKPAFSYLYLDLHGLLHHSEIVISIAYQMNIPLQSDLTKLYEQILNYLSECIPYQLIVLDHVNEAGCDIISEIFSFIQERIPIIVITDLILNLSSDMTTTTPVATTPAATNPMKLSISTSQGALLDNTHCSQDILNQIKYYTKKLSLLWNTKATDTISPSHATDSTSLSSNEYSNPRIFTYLNLFSDIDSYLFLTSKNTKETLDLKNIDPIYSKLIELSQGLPGLLHILKNCSHETIEFLYLQALLRLKEESIKISTKKIVIMGKLYAHILYMYSLLFEYVYTSSSVLHNSSVDHQNQQIHHNIFNSTNGDITLPSQFTVIQYYKTYSMIYIPSKPFSISSSQPYSFDSYGMSLSSEELHSLLTLHILHTTSFPNYYLLPNYLIHALPSSNLNIVSMSPPMNDESFYLMILSHQMMYDSELFITQTCSMIPELRLQSKIRSWINTIHQQHIDMLPWNKMYCSMLFTSLKSMSTTSMNLFHESKDTNNTIPPQELPWVYALSMFIYAPKFLRHSYNISTLIDYVMILTKYLCLLSDENWIQMIEKINSYVLLQDSKFGTNTMVKSPYTPTEAALSFCQICIELLYDFLSWIKLRQTTLSTLPSFDTFIQLLKKLYQYAINNNNETNKETNNDESKPTYKTLQQKSLQYQLIYQLKIIEEFLLPTKCITLTSISKQLIPFVEDIMLQYKKEIIHPLHQLASTQRTCKATLLQMLSIISTFNPTSASTSTTSTFDHKPPTKHENLSKQKQTDSLNANNNPANKKDTSEDIDPQLLYHLTQLCHEFQHSILSYTFLDQLMISIWKLSILAEDISPEIKGELLFYLHSLSKESLNMKYSIPLYEYFQQQIHTSIDKTQYNSSTYPTKHTQYIALLSIFGLLTNITSSSFVQIQSYALEESLLTTQASIWYILSRKCMHSFSQSIGLPGYKRDLLVEIKLLSEVHVTNYQIWYDNSRNNKQLLMLIEDSMTSIACLLKLCIVEFSVEINQTYLRYAVDTCLQAYQWLQTTNQGASRMITWSHERSMLTCYFLIKSMLLLNTFLRPITLLTKEMHASSINLNESTSSSSLPNNQSTNTTNSYPNNFQNLSSAMIVYYRTTLQQCLIDYFHLVHQKYTLWRCKLEKTMILLEEMIFVSHKQQQTSVKYIEPLFVQELTCWLHGNILIEQSFEWIPMIFMTPMLQSTRNPLAHHAIQYEEIIHHEYAEIFIRYYQEGLIHLSFVYQVIVWILSVQQHFQDVSFLQRMTTWIYLPSLRPFLPMTIVQEMIEYDSNQEHSSLPENNVNNNNTNNTNNNNNETNNAQTSTPILNIGGFLRQQQKNQELLQDITPLECISYHIPYLLMCLGQSYLSYCNYHRLGGAMNPFLHQGIFALQRALSLLDEEQQIQIKKKHKLNETMSSSNSSFSPEEQRAIQRAYSHKIQYVAYQRILTLRLLSQCAILSHDYNQAKTFYEQILRLFVEIPCVYYMEEISFLQLEFVEILYAKQDWVEADILCFQSLERYEESSYNELDGIQSLLAYGLTKRASILLGMEDFEEAENVILASLTRWEALETKRANSPDALINAMPLTNSFSLRQTPPPPPEDIAIGYALLGAIYHHHNEYEEAIKVFEKAEEILMLIIPHTNDAIPLIRVLINQATIHQEIGTSLKAKELYEKALALLLKRHGREYALIIQVVENLHGLLCELEYTKEASDLERYTKELDQRIDEDIEREKQSTKAITRQLSIALQTIHEKESIYYQDRSQYMNHLLEEAKSIVFNQTMPSGFTSPRASPLRKVHIQSEEPLISDDINDEKDVNQPKEPTPLVSIRQTPNNNSFTEIDHDIEGHLIHQMQSVFNDQRLYSSLSEDMLDVKPYENNVTLDIWNNKPFQDTNNNETTNVMDENESNTCIIS